LNLLKTFASIVTDFTRSTSISVRMTCKPSMSGELRITQTVSMTGGHLSKTVAIDNTKTVNGRLFFAVKPGPMLSALLLGHDPIHGSRSAFHKSITSSGVLSMIDRKRKSMHEDFFNDRDHETVGFDPDSGAPLDAQQLKKQRARMRKRRSLQDRLELPEIFDIPMPGFGDVDSYQIPVLSSEGFPMYVELDTSIIEKLHKAVEHELQNPPEEPIGHDQPPRRTADRRREEGLIAGVWKDGDGRWVVPWHDLERNFHRKYCNTKQEAEALRLAVDRGELPQLSDSQPDSQEDK
jgi:hypothetical protein